MYIYDPLYVKQKRTIYTDTHTETHTHICVIKTLWKSI